MGAGVGCRIVANGYGMDCQIWYVLVRPVRMAWFRLDQACRVGIGELRGVGNGPTWVGESE